MAKSGFPNPRFDRICITSRTLRQTRERLVFVGLAVFVEGKIGASRNISDHWMAVGQSGDGPMGQAGLERFHYRSREGTRVFPFQGLDQIGAGKLDLFGERVFLFPYMFFEILSNDFPIHRDLERLIEI